MTPNAHIKWHIIDIGFNFTTWPAHTHATNIYRATLVAGRVITENGKLTGDRPGRLARVRSA